jgi:putative transposase
MGIEQVVISTRSPWQNPYVERLIGSIRRECLDHSAPRRRGKEAMVAA